MSEKNFFQEFKVATTETCAARWCGYPNGEMFFCGFCGTQFKPGDKYKAVYTNNIAGAGGNPLTCEKCHEGKTDEDMRSQWKQQNEEFKTGKWRYFYERWK